MRPSVTCTRLPFAGSSSGSDAIISPEVASSLSSASYAPSPWARCSGENVSQSARDSGLL